MFCTGDFLSDRLLVWTLGSKPQESAEGAEKT